MAKDHALSEIPFPQLMVLGRIWMLTLRLDSEIPATGDLTRHVQGISVPVPEQSTLQGPRGFYV